MARQAGGKSVRRRGCLLCAFRNRSNSWLAISTKVILPSSSEGKSSELSERLIITAAGAMVALSGIPIRHHYCEKTRGSKLSEQSNESRVAAAEAPAVVPWTEPLVGQHYCFPPTPRDKTPTWWRKAKKRRNLHSLCQLSDSLIFFESCSLERVCLCVLLVCVCSTLAGGRVFAFLIWQTNNPEELTKGFPLWSRSKSHVEFT